MAGVIADQYNIVLSDELDPVINLSVLMGGVSLTVQDTRGGVTEFDEDENQMLWSPQAPHWNPNEHLWEILD